MADVKVSVIIPVFNEQELIEKCLNSIPKRDDVEIIVVNDGSTDNTINVIENYKKTHYKNLKIINYDKNQGVSYARNKGINIAKGEYLLFIDSDDYIYKDTFNQILEKYLCMTYDLIFYDIESNQNVIYPARRENYTRKYGCFKFIKKSFLGALRYTNGKQYAEDKELHLKLMQKQPRCVFSKAVMYHYNYPRKGTLSAIGEHR